MIPIIAGFHIAPPTNTVTTPGRGKNTVALETRFAKNIPI
jgi:hypothetical protein